MEYYSAVIKDILPFVTTRIDVEDFNKSFITQRKISTIQYHI